METVSRTQRQQKAIVSEQRELAMFFEKNPLAMLIVDQERRVVRLNDAAAVMTGRLKEGSIGLRGGEALGCFHAFDDPRGCGFGDACQTCIVRNTVLDTFSTGQDHRSVEAPVPYDTENGVVDLWVLVSTAFLPSPQGDRVLVCLEDITERKQAEEALEKSYREMDLREKIAKLFLTSPDDRLFSDILDLLLDAFKSRIGYVGYIDDNGDLVCPSMTQNVWERCKIPEKDFVFPRACWTGLWGQSLTTRQVLVKNSHLTLPEGHVPLRNVLVAPLIAESRLVGQIALADKPADYTCDDLKQVEMLAEFLASILRIYLDKEKARAESKSYIQKLEERNIALKVLLDNRNEERQKVVERIRENFRKMVFPYYEKLGKSLRKEEIATILEIVEANTRESLSPLETAAASTYSTLTPAEIQVADYIRIGKTSKQIAELLNISPRSVFFHRNNIRAKLKINKKKANLRSVLTSLK